MNKILQDADTLDNFNKLRVKLYIKKAGSKRFEFIRRFIGEKFVEFGLNNLKLFLNYPQLASKFYSK